MPIVSFSPSRSEAMQKIFPVLIASGLLLGAAATASAATAVCSQWQVPPGYSLNQTNGYKVQLVNGLSGRAQYRPSTSKGAWTSGDVFAGLLTASKIRFKIRWQNGALGAYDGDVSSNGHVRGVTRDQHGNSASFVGAILKCAATEPPPSKESSGIKPPPPMIIPKLKAIPKPSGDPR